METSIVAMRAAACGVFCEQKPHFISLKKGKNSRIRRQQTLRTLLVAVAITVSDAHSLPVTVFVTAAVTASAYSWLYACCPTSPLVASQSLQTF